METAVQPTREATPIRQLGLPTGLMAKRTAGDPKGCYARSDRTNQTLEIQAQVTAAERLVEKARAGDVAAFEALYRLHAERVYALCLRMSGNAQEAEELTQDAFVRAWEKLDTFRGQSAFSSWLHRLTVNVVLGCWRSKGRHRERVVAIADVTSRGDVIQTERGKHPEPRLAVDLERAIAGLPAGARTVFVLHDIEGHRHKDIAEMTGLAVGTSKTQLHRARKLLRKALGHE